MAITIGSSTITGLAAGGLPSDCITTATLGAESVDISKYTSLMPRSGTGSGYAKMPGSPGVIIQWVYLYVSTGGFVATTWPIAFPNGILSVHACDLAVGDTGGVGDFVSVNSDNLLLHYFDLSAVTGRSVYVLGIGY